MLPNLFLFLKAISVIFSLAFWRLKLRIRASIHHWTYRAIADPKNVVVIGGSFAGFFLAKQLAQSLPTGYRAIVIEKHSHYHFTWNFPRISVIPHHTQNAFIPYPTKPSLTPDGAFSFRRGKVVRIETNKVILADGSSIRFEYLAITTGSKARYPAKLDADGKAECIKFFEERQARIKAAESIVIVGGGAAGVELAGDIKSKYPQKKMTLVHSRKQLLNSFGSDLHEVAHKTLEELGVDLCLGERVVAGLDSEEEDSKEVILQSGKRLKCDALFQCTGQRPCSDLTRDAFPSSVAPNGYITVKPTFQVKGAGNVFACGDVVDLPGPKLGRSAAMQGMFVAENIVRAIKGQPLRTYTSGIMENSIELTLGLGKNVTYLNDGSTGMCFPKKVTDLDMHAAQSWKMLDMKPFDDPGNVDDKVLLA
ncbi:amid-like NADH oxidoreductase [Exophiala viscosa]|uniref:amid-like NADH oxidoreductase n=1 Tax=Exophiala viscosa TaxID=2486360 RepID=UPI00219B0DA5|nr:amid-like NADH oxidoreductase [Exophiala viscosa]